MTIKEFASLCGCNPQTLRYYDHVDLLKPVKVDEWSGYRYYSEDQALVYVKIKNLQKAGFSIDQIKELLDKDNQVIFDAFSAKIAEQEERLAEIKKIQMSYQTEMEETIKRVNEFKKQLMENLKRFDGAAEFGISEDEYRGIVRKIDGLIPDDEVICNVAAAERMEKSECGQEKSLKETFLNDPSFAIVFERHGWMQVKEFLGEIEKCESGGEYAIWCERTGDKQENIVFVNVLLNLLLQKNQGKVLSLKSEVNVSEDGQNHFWLLKRK